MIGVILNGKPLDVHGDESVQITSKMKDLQDINKIFTDFSTSFSLPASANNNRIFQHYWKFNIEAANIDGLQYIDYRISQPCNLELDGIPFRSGKLKLTSISMEYGKPKNYNCTWTGAFKGIKDVLAKYTLKDIDWYDYRHEISSLAAISIGLGNYTLYGNNVIYPLATLGKQEWTAENMLNGIIYNDDNYHSDRMIQSSDFRPATRVKEIWDRIWRNTDFTIHCDLFDQPWFDKLYLFNPNLIDDPDKYIDNYIKLIADAPPVITGDTINFDTETSEFSLRLDSPFPYINLIINVTITPDPAFATDNYTVRLKYRKTGSNSYESLTNPPNFNGVGTQTFSFNILDNWGYSKNYWVSIWLKPNNSVQGFKFSHTTDIYYNTQDITPPTAAWEYTDLVWSDPSYDYALTFPNIKQLDFVKVLMSMYNLVIQPGDTNEFTFIPYNDWKAQGKLVDITDLSDISEYTIEVPGLPKEITFEWEKPETENNKKFLELTGEAYGDEHLTTVGEADKQEIKIDGVQNLLWDRLSPAAHNLYVGKVIESGTGDNLSPAEDVPFFMFWSQMETPANGPIKIHSTGTTSIQASIPIYKLCDNYYPSVNPAHTINFGAEINAYTTIAAPGDINLYSQYYKRFISKLIDKNTRKYLIKAVMSSQASMNIELNDTLKIQSNYYDIESIKRNLLTKQTNLVLTNTYREITAITPPPPTDNTPPTVGTLSVIGNINVGSPDVPTLTVTSISQTTVNLVWGQVSGPNAIVDIEVYKDGVLLHTLSPSLHNYQIVGLTEGTQYSFYIIITDTAGLTAQSNTVTPTTLPATASYTAFSMSQNTSPDPCVITNTFTRYHDGSSAFPVAGNRIYTTATGGIFAGNNQDYKVFSGFLGTLITINNTGLVTARLPCGLLPPP